MNYKKMQLFGKSEQFRLRAIEGKLYKILEEVYI